MSRVRSSPLGCDGLGEVEVERPNVRVEVGANDAAKRILSLFQVVLRLDDLHAPRGHLRLGAVNVEGRDRSQFEGALVTVITRLGLLERFLQDIQALARLHHGQVLLDRLQAASHSPGPRRWRATRSDSSAQ